MDRTTVFTKTAKGITQVNQKSASLSKDLMRVLKLIDGKSNFGQIMEKAELDKMQLEKALNSLSKDGYARVFQVRKEEADPFAGEDDFDFTAPGKMPASTQRVIPGAANDISELVRQQERQDADKTDKRAREQAHEQARLKAKAEAESRAKLEAEARSKVEAEQKAMEQAKRAKEASERAKADLDAQMREEEARKRVLADQQAQARLTAEQKTKEAEETKRLGEIRAKAERDAKALAEARARAEAEAQAMARARAEAEAAAKRQATQATGAEAELKARLKEEIEARIRSEMEELLRNEFEDKTRAEMQAQIMEEAKLAAKAELEERLREERQALAGAEMEARKKAETESRARADNEAKLRAQAEARAAAETEARIKAEDESRKLRREAERAREEASERAKEQEETNRRLEAERRGKIEAEARAEVEAEERERREKELQGTIEAERKAKEEAEMRARIEARARETIEEDTRVKVQAEIEGDMTKRAEIEGKAQAKAYMHAKAKAESDEDERLRGEQAKRAREIADVLRTKVEPDDAAPDSSAPSARRRAKKKSSIVKPAFYSLVGIVLLGIILLHVVPLRAYTAKVERAMAAWLHDDVSIGSMTFRLIPTPHLKVESIAVGKLLDAKASTGRIYMDIATLFGEKPNINSIELDNVTISNDAVKRIAIWGRPEGKSEAGGIDSIKLRAVTLDVKPSPGPFDATLSFARNGALRQAFISSAGAWTLGLKPVGNGMDLDFYARNWTLPVGAALPVSEVKLTGNWTGNEIVVPEFEADAMEGKIQGTLRVTWGPGVKLETDLSVTKVLAKELAAAFTKDISLSGKVDGNFSLATEGPTLEALFTSPRGQGKFRVGEGSISNIDLVAVMQSDAAGQRAGVTKFAELTGELTSADHRTSYRNIALQGGVLRGNGNIDVGANSALSGRLLLEIRSQVAQDKGAFSVSGTVGRPIIRRGG
jgi:hypothetical protein